MELYEQDSGLRLDDVSGMLAKGERFSVQDAPQKSATVPESQPLFDAKGCLTDGGFARLMHGSLDELGRLEASEHLSYCNTCLDRYTALLTPSVIRMPPHSLQAPVSSRIFGRSALSVFRRGAIAAVAAVLALTFWATGTFQANNWSHVRAAGRNTAGAAVSRFWDDCGSFFSGMLPDSITLTAQGAAHGGNHNG